jgi:hypothetical protein
VSTPEDLISVASTLGYQITIEDLEANSAPLESGKLSDEQLKEVSGGLTMTEYAVIGSVVVIVAVPSFTSLGSATHSKISSVAQTSP